MAEPLAPLLPPGVTPAYADSVIPSWPLANPSVRRRQTMNRNYGALDLGTNNCRLLIAHPQGNNFVIVDAFSRIVRLGEGLAQTGALSQAAMDRTIMALTVCAEKLIRRDVYLSRAVATQACRSAQNSSEFVDRVHIETGIALDVISAEEEARLAVLGCHTVLANDDAPALIFDIGGGSTELIVVDTRGAMPTTLMWLSVPWGVVSLSEAYPESDDNSIRRENYAAMRAAVREHFSDFARQSHSLRSQRLLGTSGTVTTLASVYLQLAYYDRSQIDGLIVPAAALRAISQQFAGLDVRTRAQMPCIGTERADLVVAGCAILEEIMDLWPAENVSVADRGIREGILRSLMIERRA